MDLPLVTAGAGGREAWFPLAPWKPTVHHMPTVHPATLTDAEPPLLPRPCSFSWLPTVLTDCAPTPRPDLNKRRPNHTPLTPRHPSVQKSTSQSVVGILNEPFRMSSLPSPKQYSSFRSQAGLPPTPGLWSVILIRNRLLRATSRGERVKGKTPQFIHHQRQFYLLTKQLPSPGQALRAGPATAQGPVRDTALYCPSPAAALSPPQQPCEVGITTLPPPTPGYRWGPEARVNKQQVTWEFRVSTGL